MLGFPRSDTEAVSAASEKERSISLMGVEADQVLDSDQTARFT
jgi:hypothetical protein